jgi:hypothetical protein
MKIVSRLALSCSLLTLAALAVLGPGCGGGGGGGGGNQPSDFIGGSGTGAGGVPVFWWRYGGDCFGSAGGAVQAADGSIVACGTVNRLPIDWTPSQNDACLIEVDAHGRVVWQRNYGDELKWDGANDVIATADGGFAFTGMATGASNDPQVYVVKTASDGTPEFERVFGEEWADEGFALLQIPSGFLVAGTRTHAIESGPQNDGCLAWLDASGALQEQKFYGGPSYDRIEDVLALPGGGYVFCGLRGNMPGFQGNDLWLVETDASGNVIWERTYGEGRAASVARLADGGFVITGSVPDPAGSTDCLVLCTDADGHELWRRTFGGPDQDGGEGICVTHTNQILVSGVTQSFTTGPSPWERQDVYLLKLDPNGDVVWQKVKGRWPESSDLAASIQETSDGGMLLCGGTSAHMMIAKADANGDTIRLGDLDVTMTIPNITPGTLNFYNAVTAAKGAVSAVMNMREIGPFATGMLVRTASGDTSADICDLGGSLSFVPQPGLPLSAGQHFAATFDTCTSGPPPGTQFGGGYTIDLVLVQGDPTTPQYQLAAAAGVDITVTDDVGTTSVLGDVSFERSATSASQYDENTDILSSSTLSIHESGSTVLVSQGGLTNGLAGGWYYLGPGDLLLTQTYISGVLALSIPPATRLTGATRDSPSSGWMSVTAADGSTLRITATGNGQVRLDIDTDADGTIDFTRAMRWEDLD